MNTHTAQASWRAWLPPAAPQAAPAVTGPQDPPGYPADCGALPRRPVTDLDTAVWVVGAHGGAGESTLAGLAPGWRAAEHAWPALGPTTAPACVLCARTSASGLLAAQAALTQWAAGGTGVTLLGLVLLADAPGRLPGPLRDLARVVSGGAPRHWSIPWVPPWRAGDPHTPREVRRLITDVTALTTHHHEEHR